ncbi:radical SAM protein [uncultured Methanospirillum sp.]|uniref:radical SAM protein n=1 Tax=uncultured Methanospirillum sp. TaxID=262503 RepID=UPI0029C9AC9C|nr:radical SAM protein [uncultured Methanospirillum sp.]
MYITTELTPWDKATLISIGHAMVDPELQTEEYVGRSTAGPGAGGRSVFFTDGKRRVRVSIKNPNGAPLGAPDRTDEKDFFIQNESPLRIRKENGGVVIERNGEILAKGSLEPVGAHCPQQAYITVSEQCAFHCAFCPVPRLNGQIKSREQILSMIDQVYLSGDLRAISLTGGVTETPEKELDRMKGLVKDLVREYDVPIGVSVYPTPGSSEELYAAGAHEIKYNVETMDPVLFSRFCPDLGLDHILNELKHAVPIYGKNRVSSNMIIGLGESDETVILGAQNLASIGVLPVLRAISVNPDYPLEGASRPSAERLYHLAQSLKKILEDYNLSPLHARTMCLPCTGCDLIPGRDL